MNIVDILRKTSIEDLKSILNDREINFFNYKNLMDFIVDINDFNKFELFYNDKRSKSKINNLTIAIKNNNEKIINVLIKDTTIIKHQNRIKNNILLSLKKIV